VRFERVDEAEPIPYRRRTARTSSPLYVRVTVTRTLLLIVLSCGSLGLVACRGSDSPKLSGKVVSAAQWKAVLRDWYDGRISERHSCGAVVVASSHLPVDGPIYSTIDADLARYAAKVCTHHSDLAAIKLGMSDADVAAITGAPTVPASGSCWDYRSSRRDNTDIAVCFGNGRVISKSQVTHF
jgi:hypothetical protein